MLNPPPPVPPPPPRFAPTAWWFALVLPVAVFAVYLPGLHNALLFDDLRLSDGTIFGQYGALLPLKPRLLSYGSFVWVDALLGSGWWKQRLVNVVLHLATAGALYALLRALLLRARPVADGGSGGSVRLDRPTTAALRVGVLLFALNPVAVYAVGYLTQRSIVLATLLSVLACWAFVRGLERGHAGWWAAALAAYVLALLAKEYALFVAALAPPLFIYVRRPGGKTVAALAAAALLLLAAAALLLARPYGGLVGQLIDPRSVAFAQQIEQLSPGAGAHVWALSVVNQMALFFRYGLLWVLPNVQWLSIDLRPAFPLSVFSWPQLPGAVSYLALLAGAVWLLLRRDDSVRSLLGLLLLVPGVLFATEFAIAWIQDPFVLYRSYLWAIALPGLLAIALRGLGARAIYLGGLLAALVFAALALERVHSLKDEFSAWGDAAQKIDRDAPPNAVGRFRPFLNLGAAHLGSGSLEQARSAFLTADALGDLGGNAQFNLGVTYQQQQQHQSALAAFAAAAAKGFSGQALDYQRGESQLALGLYADAYRSFDAALKQPADDTADAAGSAQLRRTLLQRRADSAIGANRFDQAIADFTTLLQTSPNDTRLLLGLGMARIGQGDTQAAIALFDRLLAARPLAPAFYGRAVARLTSGDRNAALADLDRALALDPRNVQYARVRAQIAAAPAAAN